MDNRYARIVKRQKTYEANAETMIERVKKMRALNCNPSDIGISSYVIKRLLSSRSDISSKFL